MSLEAQEGLTQAEVIVVNDGADPAISGFLKNLAFPFSVYEIPVHTSKGSYNARNLGIRQATAPYLIFLDDSILLPPDWFLKLKPLLAQFAYIACEVRIQKEHEEKLSEKFFRLTAFQTARYVQAHNFGLTCCLAVQKQAFEKTGLFDDHIFSGGDREFGQRLHGLGLSQTYFDAAMALHPAKDWQQQFRVQTRIYKGMLDLAKRYPERYSQLRPTSMQLLHNFYGLVKSLLFASRIPLYQSGAFTYREWVVVKLFSTWLYSKALIKILVWKKRDFNE